MNQHIETNPLLDRLPPHLQQYIKPQDYDDYTAINQAVWRYVLERVFLLLREKSLAKTIMICSQ